MSWNFIFGLPFLDGSKLLSTIQSALSPFTFTILRCPSHFFPQILLDPHQSSPATKHQKNEKDEWPSQLISIENPQPSFWPSLWSCSRFWDLKVPVWDIFTIQETAINRIYSIVIYIYIYVKSFIHRKKKHQLYNNYITASIFSKITPHPLNSPLFQRPSGMSSKLHPTSSGTSVEHEELPQSRAR